MRRGRARRRGTTGATTRKRTYAARAASVPEARDSILSPVSAPRDEARGLSLVALSTLAYGVLPIFVKVAYAAGVTGIPMLAWRYGIAAILIAATARLPRLPLRDRARLWAIGFVFVFNSITYFRALETVPASVTALVLYTYPVIVTLLAAAAGVEPLTGRGLVAALAAFAGCALTAGGAGGRPLPAAGIAWALAAAFIYLDQASPPDVKGSMQTVYGVLVVGLGMVVGGIWGGWMGDRFTTGSGADTVYDWNPIWLGCAALAAVCTLVLAVGFPGDRQRSN